jgi:3-hydroxybutyryl-CoA dehydrogenase
VNDALKSTRVAVVGAGYMGLGIAQVLATAGAEVAINDSDPDSTVLSLQRLRGQAQTHERLGLVPPGTAANVGERVRAATSFEDALEAADLVIEAVPENPGIKTTVWKQIERFAPEAAVLATNTSSIPIAELARSLRHPHRLIGMHWFNPAPFVPGIEVIPGPGTPGEVVDWVVDLAGKAGKTATVVADAPGFVANRLQFALFREAASIVEEGVADAAAIDAVVQSTFGFRLPFFGPFAIADMAGLDVYQGAFEVLGSALGERFTPPTALTALVGRGDLGAKTGRGFLTLSPSAVDERARSRDEKYRALENLIEAMNQTMNQTGEV